MVGIGQESGIDDMDRTPTIMKHLLAAAIALMPVLASCGSEKSSEIRTRAA